MGKATKPSKLEREKAEITGKITSTYEKLADKFRKKTERAAEQLKEAKKEYKRDIYRQRFELYGDVTTHLDERLRLLRHGEERGSD